MKLRFIALTAAILGATPASAAPRDWVATHQTRDPRRISAAARDPERRHQNPRHPPQRRSHHGDDGEARPVAAAARRRRRPTCRRAIYGEWLVPGATRTLVLYAHYDGQPVTPEDWKSTPPFRPSCTPTGSTAAASRSPDRRRRHRPELADLRPRASDDKAGRDGDPRRGRRAEGRRASDRPSTSRSSSKARRKPARRTSPRCSPSTRHAQVRRLGDHRRPGAPVRPAAGRRSACAASSTSTSPSTGRCGRCTAAITAIGRPTRR